MDGDYAVVIFGQPITVYGMASDGSGKTSQASSMLGVAAKAKYEDYGDLASWRAYDGQTVVVAATQEDIWFPSDVRLPLGEPAADECDLLDVA